MILFEHGRSNIADEKYHYKGVEGMDSGERIELHIHSKEGGDSTLYAGEVIKQLDERGIPAVAITNTSSIFCFPEISVRLKTFQVRLHSFCRISWQKNWTGTLSSKKRISNILEIH